MEPSIAWWDWIGIGLGAVGLVAFLMAVQPFIQFLVGSPKLEGEWDIRSKGNSRSLYLSLYSPSVSRKFRRIGVRRDPINGLTASGTIIDARTHKVVVSEDFVTLLDPEGEKRAVVDISSPEAVILIWVAIVRDGSDKAFSILSIDEDAEAVELPPGEYWCSLNLKSASVEKDVSRKFFVGSNLHQLYWETSS